MYLKLCSESQKKKNRKSIRIQNRQKKRVSNRDKIFRRTTSMYFKTFIPLGRKI